MLVASSKRKDAHEQVHEGRRNRCDRLRGRGRELRDRVSRKFQLDFGGGGRTGGWGGQRSDETLLTGSTAASVRAAALKAVVGGTIVRVETDADGHALYEAHMTKADGTPVTVYVDKSFNVVSVESR